MKTILVPTDFSQCAGHAMVAAVQLAEITGAEITLMHSIFTETILTPAQKKHPEISRKYQEAIRNLNDVAGSFVFKNVAISKYITYGIPYEQILKCANQVHPDLIIMGTHGNELCDKPFIGSTTQKVLRESSYPVLMIKKEFELGHWKKIAVASDLRTDIQKPFEKIKKLIKTLNAIVYLVFINRPTDFMDTQDINKTMDALITQHPDVSFVKVIYVHPEVADGVLQYAKGHDIDWTAVITHDHVGKPQYVIGNTETLAFKSSIPVMSVRTVQEPLSMT